LLTIIRVAFVLAVSGARISLVSAAGQDALEAAHAAWQAGDLTAAEQAVERAISEAPDDGEAHLLLGLVRFRAGRHEDALAAFEAAARAARPADAGVLAFNRGAALYELGRFTEAEAAYVEAAAADQRLAAVATLDAGLAARDAGALERARAYAARASELPRGDEIAEAIADLRADVAEAEEQRAREAARRRRAAARAALAAERYDEAIAGYLAALRDAEARARPAQERAEILYALGTAQLRARRIADAQRSLDAAARLAPREAEFQFMAAEAALRLDDRPLARRHFEDALAAGIDADSAAVAHAALDALSPGLHGQGRGVSLNLVTAAGYDSNVAQAGVGRTEVLGVAGGSGYAEAALDGAWRFPLGRRAFGELAYGFDQVAFFESGLDRFALQQQSASATAESQLAGRLRAALMAGGDYMWTGLESFTPFLRTLALRPGLAIDEGERSATRVELEHDWKHALTATYGYFEGTRTDLVVSQELGGRRARGILTYRFRDEVLPNPDVVPVANLPRSFMSSPLCQRAGCTYVISYAYRSQALLARVDLELRPDVRLTVAASAEDRPYTSDSFVTFTGGPVGPRAPEIYSNLRHDHRFAAGLALVVGRADHQLTLRYDLVVNRSNVDDTVRPMDYDNKNFTKHVVGVELGSGWLWGGR
jgi:tetratricopeptide (TPR) repeat protein